MNEHMDKEEFLKALNEEGLLIYGTTWLKNFRRLQELKKYKEMWEEITSDIASYNFGNQYHPFREIIRRRIEEIKQRYFPEEIRKELIRKRIKGLLEVVDEIQKALNVQER